MIWFGELVTEVALASVTFTLLSITSVPLMAADILINSRDLELKGIWGGLWSKSQLNLFHLHLTCSSVSRFLADWQLEVFTSGAGEALIISRIGDLKMHIIIAWIYIAFVYYFLEELKQISPHPKIYTLTDKLKGKVKRIK